MTARYPAARQRGRIALYRLLLLAAVVGLWYAATGLHWVSRLTLPGPNEVARRVVTLLGSDGLWSALLDTAQSWAVGLFIAFVGGNVIGLAIGWSERFVWITRSTIDLLRSVPSVTLVPLAVLLYGTSLKMKLVLIVFGAIWEVIVQAIYAARQVDPVARDTMRAFDVSAPLRMRFLVLPSAAPFIATGFRLAAVAAFLLSIGAEIVGGAPGLGKQLSLAQDAGDLPTMYSYILFSAAIGIVLNIALARLDRRVLRGHPGFRAA